jgi:hypothetical protein
MKRIFLKFVFLILPVLAFLSFIFVAFSKDSTSAVVYGAYPPPTSNNGIGLQNLNLRVFLPSIQAPWKWSVLPVTPPISSQSYYLSKYDTTTLYNYGCDLGTRDLNIPGTQDSFVFLDMGHPYYKNSVYGVQRENTDEFHSVSELKNAAYSFAIGYYVCVGSDTASQLTIAIGTNNWDNVATPEDYVTAGHGSAWGDLVLSTQSQLAYQSTQIAVVGASDMEIDWNDPTETKAWTDAFIAKIYHSYPDGSEELLSNLFDIGDAAGCPYDPNTYAPSQSYWTDACGTADHPNWTASDVVHLANRPGSRVMPMMYAQGYDEDGWRLAAQWQGLGMYNKDIYGYQLTFRGSTTQRQACVDQGVPTSELNTNYLCATPEEGYKKLYSTLNTFDKTKTNTMKWSTDMHWMP